MAIFNAFLNLSELKELYSGNPVCVCPLYNGVLNTSKTFEATGNPIVLPEYKTLIKLTTEFSPKQAGTGDPSPDNVRPISGWDNVKITVSNESESHDYNITIPETIGGTVDAVTGVGEKTWEFVEFDGSETIEVGTDNLTSVYRYYITSYLLPSSYIAAQGVCSHLPVGDRFQLNVDREQCIIGSNNVLIYLYLDKTDFPDINSVSTWLAAQASAGTPVQVAYKLATPEPFEISQVSIPSLRGENKFFTNGENMDIICKIASFWSDGA